jgi:hypothetical protein
MRRGLLALLAVLAGLLVAATAAYGAAGPDGHNPPGAWVRYRGDYTQSTNVYYEDWHYWKPSGWIHKGPTTYTYDWPVKDYVKAGTRVNLVIISYGAKPDELHMRRFGDVAANRSPIGRGVRVPYHYYPMMNEQGNVDYWAVYFKLPNGDHRIKLFMRWDRMEGTQYSYGKEVRLVHLKAK